MRIGFDAKRAFQNQSGLGNYSRSLISAMEEFNPEHEYILYAPKKTNLFSPDSEISIPNSFLNNTFKSAWRSYGITKELEKDNIDVYHGLSHELPIGIEKTKTRSVVTIHDLIFLRYPDTYKSIDRKIYLKKVKHSCEVANKIIAISEQTKQDIINFLNVSANKIEVVYQNCDDQFKRTALEEILNKTLSKYQLPERYILSVGTIEERKNLISVIRAFKKLNDTDIHLVVVGKAKEPYSKNIEKEVTADIKNRIHFIRNADFGDLPSIYQAAEMLVYPSLFEGFGIPIIEALYSKTPVITSNEGCFKEIGGTDSRYVDPLNIEELTNTMTQLLENEALRKDIIEKGYSFVQQFNNQSMAEQLNKIYTSLV